MRRVVYHWRGRKGYNLIKQEKCEDLDAIAIIVSEQALNCAVAVAIPFQALAPQLTAAYTLVFLLVALSALVT